MACDFGSTLRTLGTLQKTKPEKFHKFYSEHGSLRNEVIDQRLKQIRAAISLTQDGAVVSTSVIMVETILSQLSPLLEAIRRIDKEIEAIFRKHPDFEVFDSFPGAGAALAPRLQAAMGSDRDRF